MFSLRFAAARVLSARSVTIAARPRTISSLTVAPIRQSRIVAPLQFQKRWASNEAEAKKEEEVPVSQIQPTPQEEVENALQTDKAATDESAPPIAETANATEATEEATSMATEPKEVASAAGRLTEGLDYKSLSSEEQPASRAQPSARDPPSPRPSIYVGNLFFDVTENDLSKEFARFGTIKSARLIRDARGLSKGFGYITFESTEEAQKAINEMNQQLFEGRRLMVSFAYSDGPTSAGGREFRPVNPPSKTLFIGNMSFEMTDRDLNNLFRGIRNVIDVRVAIDRRTGQPRGFAHADFIDAKSAQEAMKVLAGNEQYGRKLRVDFSYGPSASPRNTPR